MHVNAHHIHDFHVVLATCQSNGVTFGTMPSRSKPIPVRKSVNLNRKEFVSVSRVSQERGVFDVNGKIAERIQNEMKGGKDHETSN